MPSPRRSISASSIGRVMGSMSVWRRLIASPPVSLLCSRRERARCSGRPLPPPLHAPQAPTPRAPTIASSVCSTSSAFENFAVNSFEQLCINFANEKLQSQFISALVATQRAEYVAEGISCGAIAFPENSEQISLLDGRLGIMALLDEVRFTKGFGGGVRRQIEQALLKARIICESCRKIGQTIRKGAADTEAVQFGVRHYAGVVTYTTTGWLDKNRGHLAANIIAMLAASERPLLRVSFREATPAVDISDPPPGRTSHAEGRPRGATGKKTSTVLGRFRISLRELFDVLQRTSARYIRCLKPNADRSPTRDGAYVERRLLRDGVLAIVEVQAAGYSLSLRKAEFLARYSCCAKLTGEEQALIAHGLAASNVRASSAEASEQADVACTTLLAAAERTLRAAGAWRCGGGGLARVAQCGGGLTKVFLREKVVRQLEGSRDAVAAIAAVAIQRFARVQLARGTLKQAKRLHAMVAGIRAAPTAAAARTALLSFDGECARSYFTVGSFMGAWMQRRASSCTGSSRNERRRNRRRNARRQRRVEKKAAAERAAAEAVAAAEAAKAAEEAAQRRRRLGRTRSARRPAVPGGQPPLLRRHHRLGKRKSVLAMASGFAGARRLLSAHPCVDGGCGACDDYRAHDGGQLCNLQMRLPQIGGTRLCSVLVLRHRGRQRKLFV